MKYFTITVIISVHEYGMITCEVILHSTKSLAAPLMQMQELFMAFFFLFPNSTNNFVPQSIVEKYMDRESNKQTMATINGKLQAKPCL